jgi:hypothetical protein
MITYHKRPDFDVSQLLNKKNRTVFDCSILYQNSHKSLISPLTYGELEIPIKFRIFTKNIMLNDSGFGLVRENGHPYIVGAFHIIDYVTKKTIFAINASESTNNTMHVLYEPGALSLELVRFNIWMFETMYNVNVITEKQQNLHEYLMRSPLEITDNLIEYAQEQIERFNISV